MCRRTVRKGLILILAGVVSVTLATFLNEQLGRLFFLLGGSSVAFTYYGLTLGGASGACGVLVAIAGLLRSGNKDREVRLTPVLLLLATAVAIFFLLSYFSFTGVFAPAPRPGESITI